MSMSNLKSQNSKGSDVSIDFEKSNQFTQNSEVKMTRRMSELVFKLNDTRMS